MCNSIFSDSFIIHSLLHPNFTNRLHFSYRNFFLVILPLPIYFSYRNTTFLCSSFFPSHPLRILCLSLSSATPTSLLHNYPHSSTSHRPSKTSPPPLVRDSLHRPLPRLTTFLPPPQSSLTCRRSTSNRGIIYLFTQNFLVCKGRNDLTLCCFVASLIKIILNPLP